MSLMEISCIFPVTDIKKTACFYVSKLGYKAVEYLECKEAHICLYRDKTEIILLQAQTKNIFPNRELYGYGYDAYLYTDDNLYYVLNNHSEIKNVTNFKVKKHSESNYADSVAIGKRELALLAEDNITINQSV